MTWKLILALVVGFCISSAVGAVLVPYLRKIKAGQAIREDGPTWHMSKTGTPTMGGLMFIIATANFFGWFTIFERIPDALITQLAAIGAGMK